MAQEYTKWYKNNNKKQNLQYFTNSEFITALNADCRSVSLHAVGNHTAALQIHRSQQMYITMHSKLESCGWLKLCGLSPVTILASHRNFTDICLTLNHLCCRLKWHCAVWKPTHYYGSSQSWSQRDGVTKKTKHNVEQLSKQLFTNTNTLFLMCCVYFNRGTCVYTGCMDMMAQVNEK